MFIEYREVTKAFDGRPVLRGLSLAIARGEVMFIVGTSGVGKSVTIKLLVGLLRSDGGQIWFDRARVDQ
ncbi:MAG: ATP-binding cassette domain-containing protein, partial [bacterium]